MNNFEKRIEINENRTIIYNISEGYCKPTYSITEGIIEDGKLIQTYSLSQWDDYGLNGWANDDNANKVSFEFDIDHPLYIPLFHLLNYDKELIIDDDDTLEYNKKYLSIYRKDNKIIMDFIDKHDNQISLGEKFHIFIKNILPDGRSKIDKNTKERLFAFFNEAHDTLTKDYHQISIEECLIKDSTELEIDEIKRVFRKNNY